MRIAIPISRFERSGGIRVLTILANGMAERGYQVLFVVPRGQHTPTFPLDRRVMVHVVEPNLGQVRHISGLLKKVQLAYGIPSVDIAIANAYMTAYSVWLSTLLSRVRYPHYFVQGYEPLAFGELSDGPTLLGSLKKRVAEYTYRLPLTCVANSRSVADSITNQQSQLPVVLPLGVDTEVFRPLLSTGNKTGQRKVVSTIGNRNRVKRFDLFVEVMRSLHLKAGCEALVITGDRQLELDADVPGRLVYPACDEELSLLYNQADIFLSTSTCEGFGLPLLEAMACGVPVVATDSGGIREFCEDRVNCLIVTSDAPEDLVAATEELLYDEALRSRLIANGLETARLWKWEKLIDRFEELIQSLT